LTSLITISCDKAELIDPAGFKTDIKADSVVFAQIGDFGHSGTAEKQVADMVKSWNPDFIITTGDDNYYEGKFSTLIENIGQYYGDYIYNYDAPPEFRCNGKAFEEGINRFFPTPGNHDAANKDGLIPYYNYFTLPGNESYYKFSWGPVAFYSLNTVEGDLSQQKAWLEQQLSDSVSPFHIVFFHHSPYSESAHGCFKETQWDYYTLGIDVVFTGHDHIYERIEKKEEENVHYIVNGLGGMSIYQCNANPLPSGMFSIFCYNGDYGAVKATATKEKLIIEFYTVNSTVQPVDRIVIVKP
jgi:tartrate-resistant acid phosphatase type 5